MIVLDTNVLSELMKMRPSGPVIAWLDRQIAESVWITCLTVLEIRYGIELLDDGERRLRLGQAFTAVVQRVLAGRVLDMDSIAADHTARLSALAKKRGRGMELRDAMIAGIALQHGAILATRNSKHFTDCGLELVDPWQA